MLTPPRDRATEVPRAKPHPDTARPTIGDRRRRRLLPLLLSVTTVLSATAVSARAPDVEVDLDAEARTHVSPLPARPTVPPMTFDPVGPLAPDEVSHDASGTLWSLGLVASALWLAVLAAGRSSRGRSRGEQGPSAARSASETTTDAHPAAPRGPSVANVAAARSKAEALALQLRDMAACARAHARTAPSGDPRLEALADQFQHLARRTERAALRLDAMSAGPGAAAEAFCLPGNAAPSDRPARS